MQGKIGLSLFVDIMHFLPIITDILILKTELSCMHDSENEHTNSGNIQYIHILTHMMCIIYIYMYVHV